MRAFKRKPVPVPKQGMGIPLEQIKPPLDLEIGCGTGDFALAWAKKTGRPLIAIEKNKESFFTIQTKV